MNNFPKKKTKKNPEKTREIQNGNTRKYQDLSSKRVMSSIHRLQGRLFPHSNIHTIQEVPCFFIFMVNPTNSKPTSWSVHNPCGIHDNGEGGQTDDST